MRACRFILLVPVLWAVPVARCQQAQEPPAVDEALLARENPEVSAVAGVAATARRISAPQEPIVRVATVEALEEALRTCRPWTTILLGDGVYTLERTPVIRTDGVALRGESGDREKVILDRGGRGGACLMVAGADDVLIADLTCRNCTRMGIQISAEDDTQRTQIYNVKFHNIWTRMIKGTHPRYGYEPVGEPPAWLLRMRPADGSIRHCLFVNDQRKSDARDGFNGDYVGGIDMMWLKGWVIADNVFVGIRGRTGGGRGAIFLWVHCEDVVAERNVIVNCDRGICFGNPSGARPHMVRGIARNNFIVAGTDKAIEMCRTVDTKVYHNTVWGASPDQPLCIHFFEGFQGGRCFNNLVRGQISLEKGAESGHNVLGALEGCFVNPGIGDLHLTAQADAARGKAQPLPEVPEDFDRQKRGEAPDVGADEYLPRAATVPATTSRAVQASR